MTDRPEDRREEPRRTGPLGDDAETRAENRTEPSPENDATRQIPSRQPSSQEEDPEPPRRLRRASQATTGVPPGEGKETRVIRTPSGETQEAMPYPRGYFEEAEEREERLRDMYGGVDWLASFLGFVFAVVIGIVFSAVAGLVLVPLGLSANLDSVDLGPAAITGLVVVAVLLFLTYFFGGYVAGRLARFDGGRNGAMTVVWGIIITLLLTVIGGLFGGSLLPGDMINQLQELVRSGITPAFQGLAGLGVVGIAIAVGALVIELLGGFLGGRTGTRYHSEIDRTT